MLVKEKKKRIYNLNNTLYQLFNQKKNYMLPHKKLHNKNILWSY